MKIKRSWWIGIVVSLLATTSWYAGLWTWVHGLLHSVEPPAETAEIVEDAPAEP